MLVTFPRDPPLVPIIERLPFSVLCNENLSGSRSIRALFAEENTLPVQLEQVTETHNTNQPARRATGRLA